MSKNKVLILGGTGMLGHKLVQILEENFTVACTVRNKRNALEKIGLADISQVFEGINIEDINSVEKAIDEFNPDVVINAVGIIKQLPESKNDLLTLEINSIFPQKLALLTEKYRYKLINISTDCVFSGIRGQYIESDFTDAVDLYGKSKFLGEVKGENCLTLRTSIIGRELFSKHSLLEWFLNVEDENVKGFTNAIFSGFSTQALSEIIKSILIDFADLEGLYHVSSEPISKYDLLTLIKEKFNLKTEIVPYDDFVIDRSLDSSRFRKLTGFEPMSWEKMVDQMASDPTPYDKWRTQKF